MKVQEDNIKKIVKVMMAEQEIDTFKEIAEMIGKNEVTLRTSLNKGVIRMAEFIKIADLLGYEVNIQKKVG